MAGKKAHKPRETAVRKKITSNSGRGKNAVSQTRGQFEQDPKRRIGQFGGTGEPPLIKK
jgi:hypothetical protein